MANYWSDWEQLIKGIGVNPGSPVEVRPSQKVNFSANVTVARVRFGFSFTAPWKGQAFASLGLQEEPVPNPSIDTSVIWQLRGHPPIPYWVTIPCPGTWGLPRRGMCWNYFSEFVYDPEDAGGCGTINSVTGEYTAPPVILPRHGGTGIGRTPRGWCVVLAYAVPTVHNDPGKLYPICTWNEKGSPAGVPQYGLPYGNSLIWFKPN
jgi:hypothetical protein